MFRRDRIHPRTLGGFMAVNWGNAASGAVSGASAGSAFGPWGAGIGGAIGGVTGALSGGNKKPKPGSDIWQQSLLNPQQQGLHSQLVNAGMGSGAGGAFGTAADYYRNLLSDNSADYNAFAAPQLRQYNEDIIPGISEQFAGMGSGGLSSSGFRNAQIQGATDLSERLGAIRANLRQAGAQGLTNIGQLGLNPVVENLRNTPQQGFWGGLAQGVGAALPGLVSQAGDWYKNSGGNKVGQNTSPYGGASVSQAAQIRG
jgi:hypothetical protein